MPSPTTLPGAIPPNASTFLRASTTAMRLISAAFDVGNWLPKTQSGPHIHAYQIRSGGHGYPSQDRPMVGYDASGDCELTAASTTVHATVPVITFGN